MTIHDVLGRLADYPMVETLLGLAVLLVLIDYFFPTDFPAHLGYFCFAAAVFFMMPLPVMASLLIALAVWATMAVLHHTWWGKYLDNVPDSDDGVENDAREDRSEQATQ